MLKIELRQYNNSSKNEEIKIMTKEELKEMLKKYKGILNNSMIDYLNSLIELEFSIIRENISKEERKLLSEMEIYKEIANYNICKRALLLIESEKNNIEPTIKMNEESLCVYGDLGRDSIILFGFDYIGTERNDNKEIGKISLYQTINSVEQVEKEITRINNILEALEKEQNPHRYIANKYGGPAVTWKFQHDRKIKQYEDKLEKIQGKTELTDKDKQEIEITNMIHELLLEDYELTNDDFTKNQAYERNSTEQTELYKRYIKRMPKLNIKNNIKYI